jgi:hypothetical protein
VHAIVHSPGVNPMARTTTNAVNADRDSLGAARAIVLGFIAGAVAVPAFHQVMLVALNAAGFAANAAYVMTPVPPLGVPRVGSLSFWGGVWGIVFAFVQTRFPRGAGWWLAALVFGALLPSLVAWFVVAPLRGLPMAQGGDVKRLITSLLVNGAWGVGTAVVYRLGARFMASAATPGERSAA